MFIYLYTLMLSTVSCSHLVSSFNAFSNSTLNGIVEDWLISAAGRHDKYLALYASSSLHKGHLHWPSGTAFKPTQDKWKLCGQESQHNKLPSSWHKAQVFSLPSSGAGAVALGNRDPGTIAAEPGRGTGRRIGNSGEEGREESEDEDEDEDEESEDEDRERLRRAGINAWLLLLFGVCLLGVELTLSIFWRLINWCPHALHWRAAVPLGAPQWQYFRGISLGKY